MSLSVCVCQSIRTLDTRTEQRVDEKGDVVYVMLKCACVPITKVFECIYTSV